VPQPVLLVDRIAAKEVTGADGYAVYHRCALDNGFTRAIEPSLRPAYQLATLIGGQPMQEGRIKPCRMALTVASVRSLA